MSKNKNSTDVYKDVDDYLKSVFGKPESENDNGESDNKKTKKSKKSDKSSQNVKSPMIEEAIDISGTTMGSPGYITSTYYTSCSFASSCVW